MAYMQHFIRGEYGSSRHLQNIPDRFIYKCARVKLDAYHGLLNEYLTPYELTIAKKLGSLPERFNVHHIIPLSCKNTSFECNNLVICSTEFHIWIHNKIYKRIDNLQPNETTTILLPTWKPVQTFENLDKDFILYYNKLWSNIRGNNHST